jgi:hypothetical protein
MLIYVARQEVLNLSRSRHIWPKELQIISRQTDKQVKKLASIYRKGVRILRVEPFATVDDVKTGRSYQSRTVLCSPKLKKKLIQEQDHISCEKKRSDVLAAAQVLPAPRKIQMSSHKVPDYKYKSVAHSTLENKNTMMPYRSK